MGDLLCVVESPDATGTHLQALDASTGAERWRQACDGSSAIAVDEQFVYLASDAGFTARRSDTGEQQWISLLSRGSSTSNKRIAVVANGQVVVGANTNGADLTALLDGRLTWTFKGDRVAISDKLFGPLIVGRTAIVGAGAKVYSVALD